MINLRNLVNHQMIASCDIAKEKYVSGQHTNLHVCPTQIAIWLQNVFQNRRQRQKRERNHQKCAMAMKGQSAQMMFIVKLKDVKGKNVKCQVCSQIIFSFLRHSIRILILLIFLYYTQVFDFYIGNLDEESENAIPKPSNKTKSA